MPLKSLSQEKWMWANKPELAARWEKETHKGKLPDHKKPSKTNYSKSVVEMAIKMK